MKLCILGWYGTETIGDRAILDGIIKIFRCRDNQSLELFIGSLFPFYTDRAVFEDALSKNNPYLSINIFNAYDYSHSKRVIKECDYVIMGGGPLMDLNEMYILLRDFRFAKKLGIKTALVGCGYGPINSNEYVKVVSKLVDSSDVVIFRDPNSIKAFNCDLTRMGLSNNHEFYYLSDPAIISILYYGNDIKNNKASLGQTSDYIAVNFREFPSDYYGKSTFSVEDAARILYRFYDEYRKSFTLVPMHTFCIGGDDRYFLNAIKNKCPDLDISVINKPINVLNTYSVFHNADLCIGMRYHSVVIQTLLNGNNYIVDYTAKKGGKIASFICEIGGTDFYRSRTIDIDNVEAISIKRTDSSFCCPGRIKCDDLINQYRDLLGLAYE